MSRSSDKLACARLVALVIGLCHLAKCEVLIGGITTEEHNIRTNRQKDAAVSSLSWYGFKKKYNKIYKDNEEELYRRGIFLENMRYIEKHNEEYRQGVHSFFLGPNELVDKTDFEVMSRVPCGYHRSCEKKRRPRRTRRRAPNHIPRRRPGRRSRLKLPAQMDWREYGIVSPVKYQGNCGSCWAFTVIAVLEIQNIRRVGKLVDLSEQQLIDCSKGYGNHGCNGGFIDPSFHYIRDNRGINTGGIYPYEAKEGTCRFNPNSVGAVVTKWVDIHSGDERKLKETLAFVGPVAVAFDGRQRSFRYYRGGIYREFNCTKRFLDHSGVVVGYGTSRGEDYWIIKNSWGTDWGEGGYIRYSRNLNNMCGIASMASYPIVF